jgi:hypothetical protein
MENLFLIHCNGDINLKRITTFISFDCAGTTRAPQDGTKIDFFFLQISIEILSQTQPSMAIDPKIATSIIQL